MFKQVAWVGHINSDNDKWYCNELMKLEFVPKDRINDFIDLIDNRDFLRENEEYDIVVLCYIFYMQSKDDQRKFFKRIISSKWRVSDLSTPDNWKDRLIKTKAQRIIAIGEKSEIAADYLDNICGYDKNQYKFNTKNVLQCSKFCVYEKQM
jgi:hypothetical protein